MLDAHAVCSQVIGTCTARHCGLVPGRMVIFGEDCVLAEGLTPSDLALGISGPCLLDQGSIALRSSQYPLSLRRCKWRVTVAATPGELNHAKDPLAEDASPAY